MGILPGPLTALSWRTETLAPHHSAKGIVGASLGQVPWPRRRPAAPLTRGSPVFPPVDRSRSGSPAGRLSSLYVRTASPVSAFFAATAGNEMTA